ncbi:MAG: DUF58 domain-containing protein [Vicinamibacterales bacterium]
MSRPLTWLGPADTTGNGPLVSLADITEIQLLILKRMREFTIGEHASRFHGAGFDFTGLRDWEAGDRFEAIDWPQSSLTNFSPLIVREFEQPSTSSVVIVADRSASTQCGLDGVPVAAIIARAIATIGMSAVFFQDSVGLVTFMDRVAGLAGVRPRIGKGQVIQILDAYQTGRGTQDVRETGGIAGSIGGFMRRTSMVPVVSDFLFEDAGEVVRELARLNTRHDVFLALVDASFAFDLPAVSAGWVEVQDVETGRSRVMSGPDARRMAARVRAWQDEVARTARAVGLDVIRLGLDQTQFDLALMEFVAERRLRRTTS